MKEKAPLLIRRKTISPIEFIREDVMEIIAYWNSSPGLPHHRTPGNGNNPVNTKLLTKITKNIGEVIDGKFMDWPPYSKEDIIKAIDGFKTRLTNIDYAPSDKTKLKHINLSNFFFNSYSDYISSMFLECLNNPPRLLKNAIPEEKQKNPAMTKWLRSLYIEKVLLGQPKRFNQVEINKFIKGANLLFDSVDSLCERANLETGPRDFCKYTIEALIKKFGVENVKPGNIGSEWTYTELLPRYLQELGRID